MSKKLKVYTATHKGYYVGGVSVIVAYSKEEAIKMLEDKLRSMDVTSSPGKSLIDIHRLDECEPGVTVLYDGDY